ncbi:hypothetical protein GCM10020221_28580 [Streptomyces thioluteus]|uniref:Transposase n=1 Tax=Streptomyces thioluteus TaxID=66431 RepID=A0ABN3WZT4_STRTU
MPAVRLPRRAVLSHGAVQTNVAKRGGGDGADRRHPHPHPTPHWKSQPTELPPGKHRRHGLRFLALADKRGRLIWIPAAQPSCTHDITAARHDRVLTRLCAAGSD